MELDDDELKATKEMNGTAWKEKADKMFEELRV